MLHAIELAVTLETATDVAYLAIARYYISIYMVFERQYNVTPSVLSFSHTATWMRRSTVKFLRGVANAFQWSTLQLQICQSSTTSLCQNHYCRPDVQASSRVMTGVDGTDNAAYCDCRILHHNLRLGDRSVQCRSLTAAVQAQIHAAGTFEGDGAAADDDVPTRTKELSVRYEPS